MIHHHSQAAEMGRPVLNSLSQNKELLKLWINFVRQAISHCWYQTYALFWQSREELHARRTSQAHGDADHARKSVHDVHDFRVALARLCLRPTRCISLLLIRGCHSAASYRCRSGSLVC
jgi:hypothetical protein